MENKILYSWHWVQHPTAPLRQWLRLYYVQTRIGMFFIERDEEGRIKRRPLELAFDAEAISMVDIYILLSETTMVSKQDKAVLTSVRRKLFRVEGPEVAGAHFVHHMHLHSRVEARQMEEYWKTPEGKADFYQVYQQKAFELITVPALAKEVEAGLLKVN